MSERGAQAARAQASELLAALAGVPGGAELLRLARSREDLAVIGGATRDLLLGREPRELDVVVDGEAAALARELAARVGDAEARITAHGRFGTAAVEWDGARIDIAERRAESYPAPGALPQVRPGSVEEDLSRRDFTVNAIAIPLGGPRRGELHAAQHALEDLSAGRLRVLHERSFSDDPTRLLRLARYAARLRFAPERQTAELAASALAAGALASVSRARVGAELRLALGEADAQAALAAMSGLGVLAAIDARLGFDEDLARRALAALPQDARADVLLLALLLLPLSAALDAGSERVMFDLLDGLEFTAGDRERAIGSALRAPELVGALRAARLPSEVAAVAAPVSPEAVALAVALDGEGAGDGTRALVAEWFTSWRHVRLQINGEDLLAAGVPAGPEVGRRLALALRRKLDGELEPGREAELSAALEAAP